MATVEIYTTRWCSYCIRAKKFLERKGVEFTEYPLEGDPSKRQEMEQRSGKSSTPQIFIDDQSIGGFEDMVELDIDDELDPMLGL